MRAKRFPISLVIAVGMFTLTNSMSTAIAETIELKNAILKPLLTISVAAGVPGVIEQVHVQEGDLIEPNDLLVKIRDDEAVLSHQRAKVALDTAKIKSARDVEIRLAQKSSEVAEQELNRALKANSIAADTYPINEVERYRLVWERAKIEMERTKLDQQLAILSESQAAIELQQSQQSIDRHSSRSQVKGMVVSVDKHSGEWVDPNTKVLEIMSTERLRVEGFVSGNEAVALEKGMSAQVTISLVKSPEPNSSPQAIPGKVSFVSPIANPANGQVRVFIEIDNRNSLYRPGLPVTVSIPVRP
jgi:multidrug efflux pump subunit AcrA (membrane-fusion protein)